MTKIARKLEAVGEFVDGGARITVEKSRAVYALLTFYIVAMVAAFLPEFASGVLTAPPVVLALTFVPGTLAVFSLYDDVEVSTRTVLYALGLSLMSLLAMGFVANLGFPMIGVETPLFKFPLAVSVSLLVGGFAVAALKNSTTGTVSVRIPDVLSPVPLSLALLPLLSILAVTYLNATGDNLPILLLLTVFAVVPLFTALRIESRWHPYTVLFLALAVGYHKSFWKNFGFSGSPGVIRAWLSGRWSPGVTEIHPYSTELLQNGVLFPTYARLSGITIITELEVVNPFLIAFIPVGVFVVARHYFSSKHGVLAASLFIFAHPFYIQYPTAGRAGTPVLFLSLFAVALSDDELSSTRASLLGLLFASGIVVTHYGTAYFVMVAILGALVGVLAVRSLDVVVNDRLEQPVPDGGGSTWKRVRSRVRSESSQSILSWTLALYYAAGALGWYMYATQGRKFNVLPRHFVRSLSSLLGDELVSGRTGARLQRDYGSLSITLSKVMYILFGLLMGFGLLYVFYRWYVQRDRSFLDDHYVSLAGVMLALFGFTFVARTWGGGRPMMITLTFTSAFAVLGAIALVRLLQFVDSEVIDQDSKLSLSVPSVSAGTVLFAAMLLVLFSLNSGLASAAVLGGGAPSNVPLTDSQSSYRGVDTSAHVWINDYGYGSVYGDPITNGQTDWYRPGIAITTERDRVYGAGLSQPRGNLISILNDEGIEPGYILLTSHNILNQEVSIPYTTEGPPLSDFDREFRQRSKIYSSNLSVVYYAPESEGGN